MFSPHIALPGSIANFPPSNSYNRYLAVAAGAVRRSLKEGARLHAEARGRTDLRFAKWKVRTVPDIHYPLQKRKWS